MTMQLAVHTTVVLMLILMTGVYLVAECVRIASITLWGGFVKPVGRITTGQVAKQSMLLMYVHRVTVLAAVLQCKILIARG